MPALRRSLRASSIPAIEARWRPTCATFHIAGEYVRLLAVQSRRRTSATDAALARSSRDASSSVRAIVVAYRRSARRRRRSAKDDAIGVLTTPDGGEINIAFPISPTPVSAASSGTMAAATPVTSSTGIRRDAASSSPRRQPLRRRVARRSAHGSGSMTLADGSRYDGQFENGVRSGQGLFQSAAGRYEGVWADDVPQGNGRFDYIDGANYDGEWFGGRRNGFGIYSRVDGSNYEGDWLDDMPDGYGQLVESDDYTYEGAWSKGQRAGYGAMQIGGTFGYEGTWVANMRHGFGREVRPDGGEYTGEWREDQREGSGILRMPNGALHDGHWNHNSPSGKAREFHLKASSSSASGMATSLPTGTSHCVAVPVIRRQALRLEAQNGRSGIPGLARTHAEQGNLDAALLLGQAYRFFLNPAPDRANGDFTGTTARQTAVSPKRSTSSPRSCSKSCRYAPARSGTADGGGGTGSRRGEHAARCFLSARNLCRERSRARPTFLRSRNRPRATSPHATIWRGCWRPVRVPNCATATAR